MSVAVRDPVAGNANRAMTALEWAVERAERGETSTAFSDKGLSDKGLSDSAPGAQPLVVTASPADFEEAAASYRSELRAFLDRLLMSNDAEAGLDALLDSGALGVLLPEVKAMVGFGDGEWRHKDVWKHTKQVVRQAVPRLEIRWAALLHDIGKVRTRSISPDGEVHFFGHAEVGARMFDRINRRLPIFEDPLRNSVRFLILHHLRASQYDASWTDSAVRRFAKEMGDQLDELLCLSRADITTKRPEKKKKGLRQISELAERVRQIQEADAVVPPLPGGIGDVIMKEFAIPPSRLIGEIKKALEAAIDAGTLPSHRDADFYLAHLRDNRSKFGLPES